MANDIIIMTDVHRLTMYWASVIKAYVYSIGFGVIIGIIIIINYGQI